MRETRAAVMIRESCVPVVSLARFSVALDTKAEVLARTLIHNEVWIAPGLRGPRFSMKQ